MTLEYKVEVKPSDIDGLRTLSSVDIHRTRRDSLPNAKSQAATYKSEGSLVLTDYWGGIKTYTLRPGRRGQGGTVISYDPNVRHGSPLSISHLKKGDSMHVPYGVIKGR